MSEWKPGWKRPAKPEGPFALLCPFQTPLWSITYEALTERGTMGYAKEEKTGSDLKNHTV